MSTNSLNVFKQVFIGRDYLMLTLLESNLPRTSVICHDLICLLQLEDEDTGAFLHVITACTHQGVYVPSVTLRSSFLFLNI